MKRLLVLAYYFPPMGMSGVQRITRLVRHLPEFGWQPTVCTASPSRYAAWDDDLAQQVEEAGIKVIRTRSLDPLHLPTRADTRATHVLPTSGEKGGLLFRILNGLLVPDSKIGWLPFVLSAASKAHRSQPFDAILATGPPHSSLVGAAFLSERLDLPLVLDFRDDWLDAPRQTFATSLHRRAHAALERWAVGRADDVWTVSRPIADSIQSRHDIQPVVVPHGYDAPEIEAKPDASRERAMRIVFTGVFYGAQQPDTFLHALRRALDRSPQTRVIAVFAGLLPSHFKRLVNELHLGDHIEPLGYVSAADATRLMATADVLWMTVGHQKQAAQIVTSKLYAYFGSRRPVLGLVPIGAARDQLESYGAARIADPGDVAATANHLLSLYDEWLHSRLPIPNSEFVDVLEGRAVAARAGARLDGFVERSDG